MEADMDMDNLDRDREAEDRQDMDEAGDEETSFIDNVRNESILIIDGSNPVFTRPDAEGIPNVGRDAGVMRRYVIHDKKQFLRDGLGITVNKGDGPSSTTLYDKMRTVIGSNGKINGAEFKGKKILILKGGKMGYSTAKGNEPYVNEFKELLRKAHIEHQKTPASVVEEHVGVDISQSTMDDIVENVSDKIETTVSDMVEDFTTNTEITNNELRELRGILNVRGSTSARKLEALKVESDHWRTMAEKEGETPKGKLYEAIAKVGELKADEIRLRLNQKSESEEVTKMVEEESEVSDLTKFEKFKRWARQNVVGASAIAIAVAGIVVTVSVSGRAVLRKGAGAVSKFGKAVGKFLGKFGPLLAAAGTLVSSILKMGAKGLLFLSRNLWTLLVGLVYVIVTEYRSRRKSTGLKGKRVANK